jgi:polyhydroxyalkanoate synthesis regulator phasin
LAKLPIATEMVNTGFMNAKEQLFAFTTDAEFAAKAMKDFPAYLASYKAAQTALNKLASSLVKTDDTLAKKLAKDESDLKTQQKIKSDAEKKLRADKTEYNANQRKINQLEKEIKQRDKIFEANQKFISYQTQINQLTQDIAQAKSGGNLIAIANAMQAYITGVGSINAQKAKDAADEKTQHSIDLLTEANTTLQGNMDTLGTTITDAAGKIADLKTAISDIKGQIKSGVQDGLQDGATVAGGIMSLSSQTGQLSQNWKTWAKSNPKAAAAAIKSGDLSAFYTSQGYTPDVVAALKGTPAGAMEAKLITGGAGTSSQASSITTPWVSSQSDYLYQYQVRNGTLYRRDVVYKHEDIITPENINSTLKKLGSTTRTILQNALAIGAVSTDSGRSGRDDAGGMATGGIVRRFFAGSNGAIMGGGTSTSDSIPRLTF